MKDSPAACATIGLDVKRTKLAVFSLSAAMAGVGGALYAGTYGSVSPERFCAVREPSAPAHRRRWRASAPHRAPSSPACSSAATRSGPASGPCWRTSTGSCPAPWASPWGATPTVLCATSPPASRCSRRCQPPRRAPGHHRSGHRARLVRRHLRLGSSQARRRRARRASCSSPVVVEARRHPGEVERPLEWAGVDGPLTEEELRTVDRALLSTSGA